jgi:hypothetical protein
MAHGSWLMGDGLWVVAHRWWLMADGLKLIGEN